MTKMMEAMMSMRKMMEVNTAIIGVACIATEVDSIHPFGFSRVGCPVSDVVGQGGKVEENACGPNYVKVQSKHSFLPYGLPPNYTPPTVVYALGNNVNNFAPILIDTLDLLHQSSPLILEVQWWWNGEGRKMIGDATSRRR